MTAHQQQYWIVQRLYRICIKLHSSSASEPCLEMYEREVSLMMGEQITEAAEAWIQLIVRSLRSGQRFSPQDYLRK